MRFNVTAIELWFWRIAIICLIIYSIILTVYIEQAQYSGMNNVKLIKQSSDQILKLAQSDAINTIILNGIGEDYPPKMKLGERTWCLNRACLDGTGQN